MTQAPEVQRSPLSIFGGSLDDLADPMESRQVCEIVGQVAAEVLSEVQAGTWRPPTTLCVTWPSAKFGGGEEDAVADALCTPGPRLTGQTCAAGLWSRGVPALL
jgi:hypothetical protein